MSPLSDFLPDEPTDDGNDILAAIIAEARRKSGPADAGPQLRYARTLTETAYILLQTETLCKSCGARHLSVEGIFLEKVGPGQRILRRADPFSLSTALPRKRECQQSQVEVCIECAPELGF